MSASERLPAPCSQGCPDEKKPAVCGLFEKAATNYLAGIFLAGFLLFFGLAVALFIMYFRVGWINSNDASLAQ